MQAAGASCNYGGGREYEANSGTIPLAAGGTKLLVHEQKGTQAVEVVAMARPVKVVLQIADIGTDADVCDVCVAIVVG